MLNQLEMLEDCAIYEIELEISNMRELDWIEVSKIHNFKRSEEAIDKCICPNIVF